MPRLVTTTTYEKRLSLFKKKHPTLRNQYIKTITLLANNPVHPSLRLHRLKGKLETFYSVSINLKYRILIDFIIRDDLIILIDVGDHGLYE
ncbi:MAG: type II toxin-antitoxin system RelE/ParE family toxin [Saprospiraceae bacterium]|jgi:mRNA-degrading endonuclease YafQ of YafQ-DinJ toxin-antitoxin module|nr:type II toxin-antitoxin system RelE/ParE family toxin [Saprospiraceae bacterium]